MRCMDLYCGARSQRLKQAYLEEIAHDECFFNALYEVVNNIHLKKFKFNGLTRAQKAKLRSFAELMSEIHRKPKRASKRKELVNQTGGFIQFIYPYLDEKISQVIRHVLSKASDTGSA